MTVQRSRVDRYRDKVAATTANWILNHVATEWYRSRVYGLIELGVRSAIEHTVKSQEGMEKYQ